MKLAKCQIVLIAIALLNFLVAGITEEECDIIGAPDSDDETRTCTYVLSELEDTKEAFACVPSQEWLSQNINQSFTEELIDTCLNAAVEECPLIDSDLENKCIRDVKEVSCLSPPNLVIFELLHGLVNTYPKLKTSALDFPKLCATQKRNLSCEAIDGCLWKPYDYQYTNGDILIKSNVSDQDISISEVQRVSIIESAFPEQPIREIELELNFFDSEQSVLSFLIERLGSNDNSLTFQLAFEGEISVETFDFNSASNKVEDAARSLLILGDAESDSVTVTKTFFKSDTVLYELNFFNADIAGKFDILQIFSEGSSTESNALKIRHAINKQRISISTEGEEYNLNLVHYGPNGNVSFLISETTTQENLQNWFDSLSDILYANVKKFFSQTADAIMEYEIQFLSSFELLNQGQPSSGVLLPNEFLLEVSNTVGLSTAEVSYIYQNPGQNPLSVLEFTICKFKQRLPGFAQVIEMSNIVGFFGYSTSNLNIPTPNDVLLIGGELYRVEKVSIPTNSQADVGSFGELFSIELTTPVLFSTNITEDQLSQVFRCSTEVTKSLNFKSDIGTIQQSIEELYSTNLGLPVTITAFEEEDSNDLSIERSIRINIDSDFGTPSLVVNLVNVPLYHYDLNENLELLDYISTSSLRQSTRYGFSRAPSFRIGFSGYLQTYEVGMRALAYKTEASSSPDPFCLTSEDTLLGPAGTVLSCNEYNYFAKLRETKILCLSSLITSNTLSDLVAGIDSICNLDSVTIEVDDESQIESFKVTFNDVLGSVLDNPFELLTDSAGDVPLLVALTEEAFEGDLTWVDITLLIEGTGSLLSFHEPIPHEEFIGEKQNNPCIVSIDQRDQAFEEAGIEVAAEKESLSRLDEQMFICAGRDYQNFLTRQETTIIVENVQQAEPIAMTREICHKIELPVDDGESTDTLCVWRGNVSDSNPFSWANVSYPGISAEVIFSPCTVPLKIATRRLMRVYRLFKEDPNDPDQFPGYDNKLGSSIKGEINSFLNQDGRCSTPQDEREFTSVFTRSWQLIITHCVYVSSAVYALAGCRLIYVLNAAKGEVWIFDIPTLKRVCWSILFVFCYMVFGTLYVCLVFCIPAAVLAKFIGSEGISETILMSFGHTSAVIILYLDLGLFIKDK